MKFVIPPPPPPAEPKRRGMPASVRQAKTQKLLEESGGKRKPFNLPADAIAAISTIRARDGLKNDTAAVVAALTHFARTK